MSVTFDSYDQAMVRRDELKTQLQSLQLQLASRHVTDEGGRRLRDREYWQWKDDANKRLVTIGTELRAVKEFIRRHHAALDRLDPEIDYTDPKSILLAARRVILEYAKDAGATDKARKVLSAIEHFNQTAPQAQEARW